MYNDVAAQLEAGQPETNDALFSSFANQNHLALVVEHDSETLDLEFEIIEGLGHQAIFVSSLDEARVALSEHCFSYVVATLEMVKRPGAKVRCWDLSERLVDEVRDQYTGLPVIITRPRRGDLAGISVGMKDRGAMNVVERPSLDGPSPFEHSLEKAIRKACDYTQRLRLLRIHQALQDITREPVPEPKVAPLKPNELVFHADRVELCGVVIANGSGLRRNLLQELAVTDADGKRVSLGGEKLGPV